MSTASATKVTVVVAVLATALPIVAALVLAHQQSVGEGAREASLVAEEVLRRSEALAHEAAAAYARLEAQKDAPPCSPRNLELLREIDVSSTYLQFVGFVRDGRLLCSSLGVHEGGIALGPVRYATSGGASFRFGVDLGLGGGAKFLVLEKGGWATAVEPQRLVDVLGGQPELSLGVFVPSTPDPLTPRGTFERKWPSMLNGRAEVTRFDGRHLVVIRRSKDFDLAAYGALPEAYLEGRLRRFVMWIVPLGIAVGSLLALAVTRLARHHASFSSIMGSAIRKEELEVYYQPIVDLVSLRVVGAEALLRWPGHDGPWSRPDRFVPAAEECGLVGKVTAYVLERVGRDAPLILKHLPEGYISVNLSAYDLHNRDVIPHLRRLIGRPGVRVSNLLMEATEHSFVDPVTASEVVREIQALGLRVGIDDFGTGFSSLSYLTTLPMDFLKIDRAFVETVASDSATSEVALHIIRMARSLKLKVIAEGVQTEQQAAFLREHGVACAQGWLYGRAMPAEQFVRSLLDVHDAAPALAG